MEGITVNYNGEEKKIAVRDGMITVHLYDNNGEGFMNISGVDYEECKRYIWNNFNRIRIRIGDKFEIKVTEMDVPSTPAKVMEDKKIKRPKTKLDFFRELEVELKKQGLI